MDLKLIFCAICKKQFIPIKKNGSPPKYCSDECRHAARLISLRKYTQKAKPKEHKESRNCLICGNQFIAEGKGYHRRYCSNKCASRQEHNLRNERRINKTPNSVCPQCENIFKKHRKNGKYCSRKCYTESLKATEQISVCLICGKTFKQNGNKLKYCSKVCSAMAEAEVYRRNTLTRRALRVTNGRVEKINSREIFERDVWRCQLCGKKVSKRLYKIKGTKRYPNAPSIDHIIPISKGGEHTKENVQCACYLCNCRKGNKIIDKDGAGRSR